MPKTFSRQEADAIFGGAFRQQGLNQDSFTREELYAAGSDAGLSREAVDAQIQAQEQALRAQEEARKTHRRSVILALEVVVVFLLSTFIVLGAAATQTVETLRQDLVRVVAEREHVVETIRAHRTPVLTGAPEVQAYAILSAGRRETIAREDYDRAVRRYNADNATFVARHFVEGFPATMPYASAVWGEQH